MGRDGKDALASYGGFPPRLVTELGAIKCV